MYTKNSITVSQSYVALLYEDGVYQRQLPPGKHEFRDKLFRKVEREVILVDLRQRSLIIKGQEILTADKVAIRVSLLVYFQVRDPAAAIHNVASYEERIYEDVQLAACRFLASRDLDVILKDRNEISDAVREDVGQAALSYGVEILRADVKDLVFPGNLREIMNHVLETERQAEAQLIQARKEAEATRIKAAADNAAESARLKAEKERTRVQAEADRERFRIRLESALDEARALAEHPELIRLKQLAVLTELAKAENAKFVIGVQPGRPEAFFGTE